MNWALSVGAMVGIALSGGFVYWQVGRFAAPQVPRSLFDERKEFVGYTVGLFVGIPFAVFLVFFLAAVVNAALVAAAIDLAIIVAGVEAAQWLALRSRYFGGESGAFYALGMRSGVGGLFALAVVTQYFSGPAFTALGIGVVLFQALAVVAVEVAAALLAVRGPPRLGRLGGSPVAGGLFSAAALFLVGIGGALDPPTALLAAAAAAVGGGWVYFRLRDPVLGELLPPRTEGEETPGEGRQSTPYDRLSR